MQIRRERVHRHDFAGMRADEFGQIFAHQLVIRHPRVLAAEVRFDRERGPVVEFVDQRLPRRARLQAERIAAQVYLFTIAVRRDQELAAKRCQRIGGIARERPGLVGGEVDGNCRGLSVA